jgi:hypothetical protein
MVRECLQAVQAQFRRGDFWGPDDAHGGEMPGFAQINAAKADDERRLDSLYAVALGKSKNGCATRYNGRGDDSPHSEVLLEHETGDQDPK